MQITKIVRKGGNVEIHLEDGSKFLVTDEFVLSKGLRKDDRIDDNYLNQLENENNYLLINNSALRLISRRSHSKFELKVKLLKKKFEIERIQKVLSDLEDKGYLDDQKFAEELVSERLNRKKDGINKIRNSLYQKGVKKEIIESVLESEIDENEMIESAIKLAEKKIKLLSNVEDTMKKKQKLISFLSNKGFNFDQIKVVLNRLKLT